MDSLLHDPSSHTLVDLNTDGALGDVPDTASLSVVVLVGHTLVDGAIGLDINDVANLEENKTSVFRTKGKQSNSK